MPTNSESLNRELFRLLSKYKPKPLDAEGKATPIPDEADIFKFEFTKDGEEYGTVYVTLDEDRVLTVYFGDDVSDSPGDKTPGLDYDDTWSGLLHQLSAWRMTKGLRGFKTQNKDRVGDDMARRNHMRNKDKIAEGYYPMGKRASYSDAVPSVKIVIEHSRTIEEGEQRYRNINRIFLENQAGERYLLDTKKPGIARVYARHIAEGGRVNDDRWDHIGSLCEEYSKMAGFVRATRNGQFNESAQALVNEGLEHYQSLRESLSRMTGKRGYNAYFESWTPSLMETEGEENNLNELFVQETLDPRIESVMPILNRIHKKVSESVVDKEIDKLAEWADSLVEGEGESIQSNNTIGIPESLDQHSPVTQAITRRILMQHPDLLQKYGPEKVGDAIDSVAEFVGDVEEIGSSDVSGWVKQVVQSLDDHQGVAEGSENFTITQKNDHSYPGSIQVVITDKSTGKQTVIAGDPRKIKQQIKQEFGIDYNFGKQGVAEAVWDRPSQSYVPRDGRTFGQTNHPREEHCDACGAATGHAGPGEDSNVDDEGTVYCDDCYADQKGVAEGYEPPTSAKGSPAYRASLLRKKQERQAAADAKKKQQGVAEGSEKRCMQCGMKNCKCPGNSCKCKPIAGWVPGKGFKKAMEEAALNEKWSQKYKSSINCSHPKGFSQKAHCAGKKKHNEDITMEHVCPDCGMCQTHGNLNEIKKGQKDSNGYTRCWPGKHAEGTKTGKNGGQVRKCVPNESVDEAAIAINMKKHHKKPKGVSEDEELDGMALGELTAIVQDTKKIYHSVKNGTPLEAWMYKKITNSNEALTAVAQQINNPAIRKPEGVAEEKIKGADGKACWPGHRYNGTENGKDSCVKVKETKSNILKGLMG